MAIVSISEASRLTGKSRQTLITYVKKGKLSKVIDLTGKQGIDTSELLRVFGSLNNTAFTPVKTVKIEQSLTVKNSQKINSLETQVKHLQELLNEKDKLLAEKDKRNEDLKQSLMLLEHTKEPEQPKKRKKFLGIF